MPSRTTRHRNPCLFGAAITDPVPAVSLSKAEREALVSYVPFGRHFQLGPLRKQLERRKLVVTGSDLCSRLTPRGEAALAAQVSR